MKLTGLRMGTCFIMTANKKRGISHMILLMDAMFYLLSRISCWYSFDSSRMSVYIRRK